MSKSIRSKADTSSVSKISKRSAPQEPKVNPKTLKERLLGPKKPQVGLNSEYIKTLLDTAESQPSAAESPQDPQDEHPDLKPLQDLPHMFYAVPLTQMASNFYQDIVRYLNISDKQNAECIQEFCGRLQVGQMCYQKKLHDIVFE